VRSKVLHCRVTMTRDHISAKVTLDTTSSNHSLTTTYVMRHEERLWNVSVLQRVRLSSLIFLRICHEGVQHVSTLYVVMPSPDVRGRGS
jgi:hypothetical protein